jgi:hypothetical protein
MHEADVGELRLVVENRPMGGNGGPTLRVLVAESKRELLRFDCFSVGAHWHIDPDGKDERDDMPNGPAGVDYTLQQLSERIDPLLVSAGHVRTEPLGRSETWSKALSKVAHWMREATR